MQPDRTLNYYLNLALRRLELGEVADEARIEKAYRQLAGDFLSRLTPSILFSSGTLTLRVMSAALRQELFLRREHLRQRMNDQLGSEVIRQIIIR